MARSGLNATWLVGQKYIAIRNINRSDIDFNAKTYIYKRQRGKEVAQHLAQILEIFKTFLLL
jgi:hypothetical protein